MIYRRQGAYVYLYAVDGTGAPVTGDAQHITAYVTRDGEEPGSALSGAVVEIDAGKAPGVYLTWLDSDHTDCEQLVVTAVSTTPGVRIAPVREQVLGHQLFAYALAGVAAQMLAVDGWEPDGMSVSWSGRALEAGEAISLAAYDFLREVPPSEEPAIQEVQVLGHLTAQGWEPDAEWQDNVYGDLLLVSANLPHAPGVLTVSIPGGRRPQTLRLRLPAGPYGVRGYVRADGGLLDENNYFWTQASPWSPLDEVIEGGALTARELLRALAAVLAGKASGGGTGTIRFRDLADTKDRLTLSVDGQGNRSAVALDLTE
jgi:hypothetical protein